MTMTYQTKRSSESLILDHKNLNDQQLRSRAQKVIPGSRWGHLSAASLPKGYPQYFERADGCRLWDVDGNEYIDFMCSYGPIILGHHDKDVEKAVRRQQKLGDCMNGPSERAVELAELLVETIPHADWAMFSKNGTDATTTCVTISRAATGKRKILVAKGAYHGAAPWCTPSLVGVTAEDRTHIIHYEFNDVNSLEQAVSAAGNDLAAILVSAFRHDRGRDQEMPTLEFATRVRHVCDRSNAALIIDDVRAGLRLHLGGSWEVFGVRPDLSAWSKALSNGYPLAAVTGSERYREAAASIFVTGSFWCAAVPMAAALATIQKLHANDAPKYMQSMGQRLRNGLEVQAKAHGVPIRQSGPAQMPLVLFEGDVNLERGSVFCAEALRRGIYLHPNHTMFLSMAHSAADIDRALEATDAAFQEVARQFG
jgi:glutamate-1-semialdehyde 2,1-aminomutase